MRIPIQRWHGLSLSVPVRLELYLKPDQANALHGPYHSRSQLARDILDFVSAQLPGHQFWSLTDGGYATKDYIRQLPGATPVMGRFPSRAKLYKVPPMPTHKRRGASHKKAT